MGRFLLADAGFQPAGAEFVQQAAAQFSFSANCPTGCWTMLLCLRGFAASREVKSCGMESEFVQAPLAQLSNRLLDDWITAMSTHPYSEEHLVDQPAIQLFADLGWQTLTADNGSLP